ncbi:M67 family metallopeptidase [Egbenema bharatensis]|uniref:M67 family metallopeptidase n=1 Tax=Egbenema bharatensis TaxID=3463334 RepID=UPI003A83E79A
MAILTGRVEHLRQIQTFAEQAYPAECCGLLLGQLRRDRAETVKCLLEVWETPNAWESALAEGSLPDIVFSTGQHLAKTERYWIDPKDVLTAQRDARDRGLTVLGVYHSHPDHPAIPSECDRSLAWAEYSYLIVSVQQGRAAAIRCWSLDDTYQFQEEKMHFA